MARRPKKQHLDLSRAEPFAGYSHDEYVEWFSRMWEPENVRDLLGIAGAVMAAYELIKARVVNGTMGFYVTGFDEDGFTYSDKYDTDVLARHPTSAYLASCAWLVDAQAITDEQVAVLTELHEVRGRMVHELIGYLLDPSLSVRPGLLSDVLGVLQALALFWAKLDMETNPDFAGQAVNDDEIQSGDVLIFEQLLAVVARVDDPDRGAPADDPGVG